METCPACADHGPHWVVFDAEPETAECRACGTQFPV